MNEKTQTPTFIMKLKSCVNIDVGVMTPHSMHYWHQHTRCSQFPLHQ